MSVRKSGKHVTNSPFKILVGPSEIGDASKVRVWGKGLSEGHTFQVAEFIVDTRNAGASCPGNSSLQLVPPVGTSPLLPSAPGPYPPLLNFLAQSLLRFPFWGPAGKSKCPPVTSPVSKRKLSHPGFVSPSLTKTQEACLREISRLPIPNPLGQCLAHPSFFC